VPLVDKFESAAARFTSLRRACPPTRGRSFAVAAMSPSSGRVANGGGDAAATERRLRQRSVDKDNAVTLHQDILCLDAFAVQNLRGKTTFPQIVAQMLRQTANRTKEPSNFAVPSPLYRQRQIGVHRCNLWTTTSQQLISQKLAKRAKSFGNSISLPSFVSFVSFCLNVLVSSIPGRRSFSVGGTCPP
jgi:hypothetical protein